MYFCYFFCKFCDNVWFVGKLDGEIHVNLSEIRTFEIITLNLNHIQTHIHFDNPTPYTW
jgi:hypothetical protein